VNGTVEIDGKEDSEKIAINIEVKKPLLKDLIS
jgi:alpha-glucosidase